MLQKGQQILFVAFKMWFLVQHPITIAFLMFIALGRTYR